MRDFIDRHHLIWQSYGWLTEPENIVRLKRKFHSNFHAVFDNRTPVGQIEFVGKFNASSLSRKFNKQLLELVNDFRWYNEIYAYKDGLFIPERLLEAQEKYRWKQKNK